MKLLIADTETTGFLAKAAAPLIAQPELVEFAGAILDTEHPDESPLRLQFRCRTVRPLPPHIETLLQLRDSDLDCEKPFIAHYAELRDFFLLADGWCAHNLKFDSGIMHNEIRRLSKKREREFPWPKEELCTLKLSRQLYKSKHHKLRDFYRKVTGQSMRQTHCATDDVDMLMEILRQLISEGRFPYFPPAQERVEG